jgi:outer membrane protein OmpA-like peptidoglycan-associated protein
MKNQLILLFLFALISNIDGQSISFEENFDNNEKNWLVDNNEERIVYLENSRYIIENLLDNKNLLITNMVPSFSAAKDFELEAKIRMEEGSDQLQFGLIWGHKNGENFSCFSLNGNGLFKVQTWVNNNMFNLNKWSRNEAIKPKGRDNIIKIVCKDSVLNYYVNNVKVFSSNKLRIMGPNIGFYLEKNIIIHVDYIKLTQELTINLVEDAVLGRKREPLNEGVNTLYNEVMPLVSQDAKNLYFVRRNYPLNTGDEGKDDIWVANAADSGKWFTAMKLPAPINNIDHNQALYVSADYQTMIVGNSYGSDGRVDGRGISITHKSGISWSIPEPIDIESYVNKLQQYAISFSANRKIMMLAVAGKDCMGAKDIYVSFQIDETHYSEPINLGPVVNTYLDETTPFLAADEKTLYFSSDGHPGFGSMDVFVTKRLDDSWKNWSTPKNLGSEINTSYWDAYYNIPAVGDRAYMVSSVERMNNTDIISVKIPEKEKPELVCLISGVVSNAVNQTGLESEISFYSADNQKETGLAKSEIENGNYKVVLPLGKEYEYMPLKKGFYASIKPLDLRDTTAALERKIDIKLYPLEKGVIIPLERVVFDSTNQLSNDSERELERLAGLLDQYPEMRVQLRTTSVDKESGIKQTQLIKGFFNNIGAKVDRVSYAMKTADKNEIIFQIIELEKVISAPKVDTPVVKVDTPVVKIDTPVVKIDTPVVKVDTPIVKTEIVTVQQPTFDKNIDSKKIKEGEVLRISNLSFMADSTSFTPGSVKALDELTEFLKKNTNLKIEIGGHTNGIPAHSYCDKLSTLRAESVAKYLVTKGIPADRVASRGYGKRVPIADNATEQGRKINQRVEIKFIEIQE